MGGAAWTEEEDNLLKKCIEQYGEGKWHRVPSLAGLNRCRKSCRLRWLNYLRPNIKRGSFTPDEVELIIQLHKLLGNRWSLIAGTLPGRTANDVKNYWNCHLSKKLGAQEITETSSNFQGGGGKIVETESNVMMASRSCLQQQQQQQQAQHEDENNHLLLPLPLLPLIPKEEEMTSSGMVMGMGLGLGGGAVGDLGLEELQFGGMSSSNSATKWEWDDLELDDMELWTESL